METREKTLEPVTFLTPGKCEEYNLYTAKQLYLLPLDIQALVSLMIYPGHIIVLKNIILTSSSCLFFSSSVYFFVS